MGRLPSGILEPLLGGWKRAGGAGGLKGGVWKKGIQKAILLKKVDHDIGRWKDNLFIGATILLLIPCGSIYLFTTYPGTLNSP